MGWVYLFLAAQKLHSWPDGGYSYSQIIFNFKTWSVFILYVCNSRKRLLAQICRSEWKQYIAARDNSVYSSATAIQISGSVELENKDFNVRSLDSSSKASSRFVGRCVLDLENGCRIQSYTSGCFSFGKYLNCSKRLRRWPVMCSFRLLRLSPFSSRCSSSSGNISTFPCSTRSAHLSSFFTNASTLSFIVRIFVFGPCNDRLSMLSLSNIHAK